MDGGAIRVAGVALAVLGAMALVVIAVLLITEGDELAPVVIAPPEPTAQASQPQPRETQSGDIRVHVSGAVISPGVYQMSEGDRVLDAIAAAGGVQSGADLSALNLALRVQDEARYHIPSVGEAPSPQSQEAQPPLRPADEPPALIDLNRADADELETLPGIGPVMSERIIAYRDSNGPFRTVDDVQEVPGIGPKTLESIRPLVTVSPGR